MKRKRYKSRRYTALQTRVQQQQQVKLHPSQQYNSNNNNNNNIPVRISARGP
jgi:hypothetical protein